MAVEPFEISVPEVVLSDLNQRLALTRWPDEISGAGWYYGTDLAYLRELAHYWQHTYDWRKYEATLNEFRHFRAEVSGFSLHFIHERGAGPKPLPLLMTHGWPDSFWRFYKIIPMLTHPERYGGSAVDAFDVVVPSLPGFGFSDTPRRPELGRQWMIDMFHQLMTRVLGYSRYGAHGGDVGSGVTERLAMTHPDALLGIHLADVPYWRLLALDPGELSEAERKYLVAGQRWQREEGAYAMIQATRPQTLAYGLNDSPVGLAGWIVEKFRNWSDCGGDVESRFSKDELLTNVTIYWATQSIRSSFTPYFFPSEDAPRCPNGSKFQLV